MGTDAHKVCVICGECCDGHPRFKDRSGRYFHQQCYEKAQRAQWRRQEEISASASAASAVDMPSEFRSASEGNEAIMAHLMTEAGRSTMHMATPETAAAAEHGCPYCGTYAAPEAVICTRCGRHLHEGGHVDTKVQHAQRGRRERINPAWRTFDDLAKYFLIGLSVVFLGLFTGSFFRPDIYLVLFVSLMVAVFVLWQLCAMMLGFAQNVKTGLLVSLVPFYSVLFLVDKLNHTMRMGLWATAVGVMLLVACGGYVLWDEEAREVFMNGAAQSQDHTLPRVAMERCPHIQPRVNDPGGPAWLVR